MDGFIRLLSMPFANYVITTARAETRALIGGIEYSYLRVTSDLFFPKSILITTDFKRNSSGRMRFSNLW